MSCLVRFCRKQCEVLPANAEVNRASGLAPCTCGKLLSEHRTFAYPTGMNHVVQDCEGKFWHL